jgi:hypothetical protein
MQKAKAPTRDDESTNVKKTMKDYEIFKRNRDDKVHYHQKHRRFAKKKRERWNRTPRAKCSASNPAQLLTPAGSSYVHKEILMKFRLEAPLRSRRMPIAQQLEMAKNYPLAEARTAQAKRHGMSDPCARAVSLHVIKTPEQEQLGITEVFTFRLRPFTCASLM